MNDYLWDKTGEPEEDVRRLEELLGTLRQRPAPLRLPAEPTPAPAKTLRPFRPAYAVAAALALAAMAGLWLAFTNARDARTTHTAATSPRATEKTRGDDSTGPPASSAQLASSERNAPGEARHTTPEAPTAANSKSDKSAASSIASSSVVRRRQARVFAGRFERSAVARASAPKRREGSSTAPLASKATPPAPTREQQAAKEQLMFALRLTSAKLGDVKRKASGVAPTRQRPSPDEQNKLR